MAQTDVSGRWKGILQKNGQTLEQADVFYMDLSIEDGQASGRTRVEILDKQEMALKSFEGSYAKEEISLEEDYVRLSSNSRLAPTCKLKYDLKYIDSTGYLKGSFKSTDCRGVMGRIVAFRSDDELNKDKENKGSHLWKKRFIDNYSKGYPSPEVLEKERENFNFEPIYFDHDKSSIRLEHHQYLNKLARVLGGIHDLRVEVTGHTDAVGTNEYNIGLSERRAQAIKDYFKAQGIEPEKLEIDFKGEKQPVDSNKTADGKQRNRRVDFKFI
jgi:outer membrane protein OmpA-like peptidoglycan-associated protein